MSKYQYFYYKFSFAADMDEILADINDYAIDGWRVIHWDNQGDYAIMERASE